MSYRLGVDVGGTFTDLLLVHEKSGQVWTAKVPSTPADQSIGVLNGIQKVCERAGIDPETIRSLGQAHRILFRDGLSVPNAIARLEGELPSSPELLHLIDFVKNSERGVTK